MLIKADLREGGAMGASKARNAVLAVGAIMVDVVCCVPALPLSLIHI